MTKLLKWILIFLFSSSLIKNKHFLNRKKINLYNYIKDETLKILFVALSIYLIILFNKNKENIVITDN